MIEIRLEDASFEQDIRPLVRAFFSREEMKVIVCSFKEPEKVEILPLNYILSVHNSEMVIDMWFKNGEGKTIRKKYEYKEPEKDRKLYKNELKKVLYNILKEYTDNELPWGTLTGIRPTKIACDYIEAGKSEEEVRNFYNEQYLCGEEKTELSIEIAKKENELLQKLDYKNGYSIYIGIPFCPTTCLYCSFTSYPIGGYKKKVGEYLQALFKEINFASTILPHKKLTTVYIGGGTPTALSAEELELLLDYINMKFPMSSVKEFTVEAGRPDSITGDKLKVMKRLGVKRMSINPQTMSDKTLKFIGRMHDSESVRRAFAMAREEGIEDINMDLIVGLPGETVKDTEYTLSEIKKLNPDDLTVHALAIKRAASLKLKLNELSDMIPTDTALQQRLTYEFARNNGYEPYYLYRQKNIADNLENVGYARPGKEGLYNILIMEEKHPIIGLGAGSSCKFVFREGNKIERTENVKFVMDYIERIDEMIERKKKFLEEFGEML
nr:coproporphyrinogen dehydrogenase HemZ [uncultured Catonella sp.]